MGVSMEFYAGRLDIIGRHFNEHDFDALRDLRAAEAYADFSLHLEPADLDLLTEEVGDLINVHCPPFWEGLGEQVGGDGTEYAAFVVPTNWVSLMGTVDDAWVSDVTHGWMSLVGGARGDLTITAYPETVAAVRNLGRLCRVAESQEKAVVFCWYL